MPTVRIEHEIHDYDAWKAAFDRDPADRRGSGVLGYRVLRPIDDPNFILIDLDFATRVEAERFLDVMRRIWRSPQAAPALRGAPRTRIAEAVETASLDGPAPVSQPVPNRNTVVER
jgi:hypothetical protein